MPTTDGFDPTPPLPQFLADRTEQGNIGSAVDGGVSASRVFKASFLIAGAAAIGIAALSVGNPVGLFADVTASLTGNSGNSSPQPGTDQSAPPIQSAADPSAPVQSIADAELVPPTAKDTPSRDDVAASEPAGEAPTDKGEPQSEALFRQFQAWLTEQDAQAHGGSVQPVQESPAEVAPAPAPENARAEDRIMQKRRPVRAIHDARAEARAQNVRKQHRRAQSARAERLPVQDARAQDPRAQDPSVQNAQAASFPPLLGQRN